MIALSMIVKGTGEEPKFLRRALESVKGHVDGMFITLTGPKDELEEAEKVCQEFGVSVSYHRALWKATPESIDFLREFFGYEPHMKEGDEIFLFDEARNFNFSQIGPEYDWIFWMDCDDVLLRGEYLRSLTQDAKKSGTEAYYFNYIYQAEVDDQYNIKNIIIQHLRERLVRNSGVYKWIAPIHETLIEQRPTRKTDVYACEVLHLSEDAKRFDSLHRNLKSLELSVYQTEGKDPRPIYYLAKAFFDLNTPEYNDKAIVLIQKYLNGENPSGWQEERAQAWEYLSEIYRRQGELNNSVKACMNALIEMPENPSTYINLALSYMHKQDWERALFWVRTASHIPEKKTTLVTNPKDIQGRTLEVIFNACFHLGKIDEAWAAARKLIELFPDNPSSAQAFQQMSALRQQRDLTQNVVYLADYLTKSGEASKVRALLSALPRSIENNPFMVNLYKKNNPPKPWEKNEIAIYCGPGFTPWSPKKLENPGECFVGGSEEAVIYAAEALQKQGWRVTVYGDPALDEGEINGVQWLPYYKFNHLDNFNILIGWRDIRFFDGKYKAKKKYLWCHDIQNPLEFTKERVDQLTKVFFLSKWHRDNVPALPEDKVLLTSNGIIV